MAVLQETSYEQLYRWAQSEYSTLSYNHEYTEGSLWLSLSKSSTYCHYFGKVCFLDQRFCFNDNLHVIFFPLLLEYKTLPFQVRVIACKDIFKDACDSCPSLPKECQKTINSTAVFCHWNQNGNKPFRSQKPHWWGYAIRKYRVFAKLWVSLTDACFAAVWNMPERQKSRNLASESLMMVKWKKLQGYNVGLVISPHVFCAFVSRKRGRKDSFAKMSLHCNLCGTTVSLALVKDDNRWSVYSVSQSHSGNAVYPLFVLYKHKVN